MKKIFIGIGIVFLYIFWAYWATGVEKQIVVPEEIDWTQRFILTELKELRIDQETLKRELYKEVQEREFSAVDKALSYSANTVNFFFVFITIIAMWFWIVWWRTLSDIKKSTKENMDRQSQKIIENFQKKIEELEKEQKINIYWRQYNVAESDKEKMDILDKINIIKPESRYVALERSNVYLSMGLYEKVIESVDLILSGERTKHQPHALYNRACAYHGLWDITNVISDLNHLLQLAPEYKDVILESELLAPCLANKQIQDLLA